MWLIRNGKEEGQTDGRVDKGSDNIVIFAWRGGSTML
jgi:hypothetical protein